MSENPIANYQEKRREFRQATEAVQNIVNIIQTASAQLRNWRDVAVSNPSGRLPPALIEKYHFLDISVWPTGGQIEHCLTHWQTARSAMQQAYQAIPEDQREGIEPPPA